uniref:CAF1B/HIR1 beta-propeller domain-containing protein n=1 Tax=Anopheles maculatus TaxID=74869 RepID=A0A182SL74_9DIPT
HGTLFGSRFFGRRKKEHFINTLSFFRPCFTLPSPDQYSVAVRFCPVYFQHRAHAEKKPPLVPLPYRMVFAVATKSSVYLYDTQQAAPFALISNIHYTRLTDMSWSSDGKILIVSSTDGFCSLIFFAEDELGKVYEPPAAELSAVDNPSTPPKPAEPVKDANTKTPSPSKQSQKAKDDVSKDEKPAQLIAFRRKPKPEENQPNESDLPQTPPSDDKPVQPVEFVIQKDKIISSEEKFESPSKKDRPVTPIAVRRHPRTPTGKQNDSPQMAVQASAFSSMGKNSPKPIAIRRHPRTLETDAIKPTAESTAEEDANDTWPIDQPKPSASNGVKLQQQQVLPQSCPMETDQTEDIVLLVESDGEDEEVPVAPTKEPPKEPDSDEKPKTPRRVEFRTISTPKSKKKLL